MEKVLEIVVGKESSEEGPVISVGSGAKKSHDDNEVEHHRVGTEGARRLLEHRLLESFITDDHLNGGNGLFLVKLWQAVSTPDLSGRRRRGKNVHHSL